MANAQHLPLYIAIMCGGGGTRLWPTSRQMQPKQLQPLITNRTMLAETAARLIGPDLRVENLILVTGEAFAEAALNAVHGLEVGGAEPLVIVEPQGRNTAPCAAVACQLAMEQHPDALVALLPADHHIADPQSFRAALSQASLLAQEGYIVTLGVPPNAPETGFGYVKAGAPLSAGFAVERFVEKPDIRTAQSYLQDGGYFWNAGVFVTSAKVFLQEIAHHAPGIAAASGASITLGKRSGNFIYLDGDNWGLCPSDSIDYAVAEKTDRAAVLPINVGWSDVGSWSAIWELLSKDDDGNVAHGDVIMESTTNCLVRSGSRLVATVGLDDVIIVETADAILIADKRQVQDIKKIVERLNKAQRPETRLAPPG